MMNDLKNEIRIRPVGLDEAVYRKPNGHCVTRTNWQSKKPDRLLEYKTNYDDIYIQSEMNQHLSYTCYDVYSIILNCNYCKCKFTCQHFKRNLSEVVNMNFFYRTSTFYWYYILLVILGIVLLTWQALGKTEGFLFP